MGLLRAQFSEHPSKRNADTSQLHTTLSNRIHWVDAYCRDTQAMLDWLEKKYRAPFSFYAYATSLRVALSYPILFALLIWAISGAALTMGDLVLLNEEAAPWKRWGVMLFIVVYFWFSINSHMINGNILLMTGVCVFFTAGAITGTIFSMIVLQIIVIVGIVALVFIGLGAGFGAGLVGSLILFTLTINVPWFDSLSQRDIDRVSAYILFVIFLPLLNALWDWLSLGITRRLLRHNLRVLHHTMSSASVWHKVGNILKSIALTLIDLIAACVCLAGLLGSTALCISIVAMAFHEWFGKEYTFFSLTNVFAALEAKDYGNPTLFWVYVMLISTWVPSVAHGWIALRVIINRVMAEAFRRYATRMDALESNGENYYHNWRWHCRRDSFVFFLCSIGLPTIAVLIISFGIGYGLLVYGDGIAWLIRFAKMCAVWG